jgi:hypothetical protein
MNWKKYEWDRDVDIGKVTYYYCNIERSNLPIRDVCNDHGAGSKKEPHYEGDFNGFGTYNECADCNAPSIDSMIKNKKANILFFVTWYTGKKHDYKSSRRRYFVTGYYKMDEIKKVEKPFRYIIKCNKPFFVEIDKAFEITKEILRKWRPNRKSSQIYGNQLKFYLKNEQTEELLNHFGKKKNVIQKYVDETKKIARDCNELINGQSCKSKTCK